LDLPHIAATLAGFRDGLRAADHSRMRKRAITTGASFRRDRSAFPPTDSLFMTNFPQASGYFFVEPPSRISGPGRNSISCP
jgi:hypothetical protein